MRKQLGENTKKNPKHGTGIRRNYSFCQRVIDDLDYLVNQLKIARSENEAITLAVENLATEYRTLGNLKMKAIVILQKQNNSVMAIDSLTTVTSKGETEEEALTNLRRELEKHYHEMMVLAPSPADMRVLEVAVENKRF